MLARAREMEETLRHAHLQARDVTPIAEEPDQGLDGSLGGNGGRVGGGASG